MYDDKYKIIGGLVIALFLLAFPFWWNHGQAANAPEPVLAPEAKAAGQCIRPGDVMKVSHMQLLDDWRNRVVRDAHRYYIDYPEQAKAPELVVIEGVTEIADNTILSIPAIGPARDLISSPDQNLNVGNGRQVEMSLQNTCMTCHPNKEEFCDKCHTWANVDPFCWDCHVEPEVKK